MNKNNWKIKMGIGLMIFSVPLFLFLPAIPFISLENTAKIKLTTIIFITAEVTFWAGGLLVGKELFAKYKAYFNPKKWFKNKSEEKNDNEIGKL